MGTVSLLEQKVLVKEKEILELEEAKISFRHEFTQMLEERNFFETELHRVNDRLKFVESELERVQTSNSKQSEVYAELLNIRSIAIGTNTIEFALKNLADDAKRYS